MAHHHNLNPAIPDAFLVNVGEPGAINTTRLEVAAIVADGLNQDDGVWKQCTKRHANHPLDQLGTDNGDMQIPSTMEAPKGWQWIDRNGKPTTRGLKSTGKIEDQFGYSSRTIPPSHSPCRRASSCSISPKIPMTVPRMRAVQAMMPWHSITRPTGN